MATRTPGHVLHSSLRATALGFTSRGVTSCCVRAGGLKSRVAASLAIALAIALAATAVIAPAAASEDSKTCQRDAIIVLSQVRAARADLSEAATGSDKARCAAWRNQAAALRKASAFYKRCQTGDERARNIANANAGAAQYDNAARTQCTDG